MDAIHEAISQTIHSSDITGRISERLCTDIGPRPVCSKGAEMAAQYLAEEFSFCKTNQVHLEKIEFSEWIPGESEVTASDRSAIPHIPFSYIKDCDVQGPIVDGSYGLPENFRKMGKLVKGSILLLLRENLPEAPEGWTITEKVHLAGASGACAVILASTQGGLHPSCGGRFAGLHRAGLPVVLVRLEDYFRLCHLAGDGHLNITRAGR